MQTLRHELHAQPHSGLSKKIFWGADGGMTTKIVEDYTLNT